ncbi:hypothetical protein Gohar_028272, partial [Gossypium harknessii]|nr:hypothetical protein [Gossypium harknessii]
MRQWKVELVTSLFTREEAEAIMQIPFTRHPRENCRVWSGEATGEYNAVQTGLELKYRQVIIEGDALIVIRKVQSKEEDRSIISPYIVDIKSLSKMFNRCCFKKIYRNANGVSHAVVREGLNRKESTYLDGGVPKSVATMMAED